MKQFLISLLFLGIVSSSTYAQKKEALSSNWGNSRYNYSPYRKSVLDYGGTFGRDNEDWETIAQISVGHGVQYGGAYGVCLTGKIAMGLLGVSFGVGRDLSAPKEATDIPLNLYLAFDAGFRNFAFEFGWYKNFIYKYDCYHDGYGHLDGYGPKWGLSIIGTYNLIVYGPFGLNIGSGIDLPITRGPDPVFALSIGLSFRFAERDGL